MSTEKDIVERFHRRYLQLETKRKPILPFWQELAEQFHPYRAQFTRQFYLSEQFMDIQLTSYPLIVARELQGTFSAMLRPRDQDWFEMTIEHEERLDRQGKAWLEWATKVQRRVMYDRRSSFVRATKEGDQDFTTFGNAAIHRETDFKNTRMQWRCRHLKSTVWAEGPDGAVNSVFALFPMTAENMVAQYKGRYDPKVDDFLKDDPYREIQCLHVVVPGEDYDRVPAEDGRPGALRTQKFRTPYAVLTLDVQHNKVLEERGSYSRGYTIPRWQTVSGSQWAYSPAAVAGLPDARLLQAMTLTLMEAGELTVRPPMVATQEAVKSDVALYSGGITWVDAEYDERLGEAIRPLITTQGGLPAGEQLMKDAREKLSEAFYLNKLTLPAPDREMTAYETGQRIQEWIRSALPLFEPVEQEYNAALCEDTFDALMRVNAFGPWRDIPRSIRGQDVRFKFESPLHQATERKKGQLLLEAINLMEQAGQIDPAALVQLDVVASVRDSLEGIGITQTWMRDAELAAQMAQQKAQEQAAVTRTAQITNAGQAAKALGDAAQSFTQGQ